jgi:hypothetical protein
MTKLTPEQEYKVNQVIANLEIENMHVTPEMKKDLAKVASGEKTTEQIIQEIKKRYTHV